MDSSSFSLVRIANGAVSVKDLAYGEVYHPVIGPEQEARLLYVDQLRLQERMAKQDDRSPFVVWDVGLGIAANAMAVLQASGQTKGHVHIISFDRSTDAAHFALRHANELAYLTDWRDALACLLEEQCVDLTQAEQTIHWQLTLGDFPTWLEKRHGDQEPAWPAPHAILFDPCSPARNPEMWTGRLFRHLRHAVNPAVRCELATYSRATHVRVGLLLAGFYVGRGLPAGAKEETTMASSHLDGIERPLDRAWLKKVETSSSAEPLSNTGYRQAPLTPASRAALHAHPQFV